MPSTPSRYPSGLSVFAKPALLANMPVPSHLRMHEYVNDFDTYNAADWTIVTSTGSNALVASNGGKLVLTTAATNTDIQSAILNPANVAFVQGVGLWFSCNFTVADLISGFRIGLQTGGTPFAPTDGVFFQKVTTSANVDFVVKTGGASTTLASVTTIAATVPISLGFYFDGLGNPTLYAFSSTANFNQASAFGQPVQIGGNMVGALGVNATSGQLLTNLPLSNLSPAMAIQAGAAAAKTLTVDYITAANEQLRV